MIASGIEIGFKNVIGIENGNEIGFKNVIGVEI